MSMFEPWRGFTEEKLSSEWYEKLTEMGRVARGHILKMTTVAGSGHPGGPRPASSDDGRAVADRNARRSRDRRDRTERLRGRHDGVRRRPGGSWADRNDAD